MKCFASRIFHVDLISRASITSYQRIQAISAGVTVETHTKIGSDLLRFLRNE